MPIFTYFYLFMPLSFYTSPAICCRPAWVSYETPPIVDTCCLNHHIFAATWGSRSICSPGFWWTRWIWSTTSARPPLKILARQSTTSPFSPGHFYPFRTFCTFPSDCWTRPSPFASKENFSWPCAYWPLIFSSSYIEKAVPSPYSAYFDCYSGQVPE